MSDGPGPATGSPPAAGPLARLLAGLDRTDRVVLAYDLALLPPIAAAGATVRGWELLLAFHLLLPVAILLLARLAARPAASPAVRFLHRWYPVLLLLVLYPEAGLLRHVVVRRDLDPELARLDARLFPGELHLWGAHHLPVAALELAHAFYFSYYLLLFVPALVAARRRPAEVERYVFTLVACLLAHYLVAIVLPTSGPLSARAAAMPRGWLFLPLMSGLYTGFDRGGLAFPSTHAAVAVVAAAFAGRFFPARRVAFWLWGALVAASTIVCGYHFTIDTVTGVATGGLCLWLWGRAPAAAPVLSENRAAARG